MHVVTVSDTRTLDTDAAAGLLGDAGGRGQRSTAVPTAMNPPCAPGGRRL